MKPKVRKTAITSATLREYVEDILQPCGPVRSFELYESGEETIIEGVCGGCGSPLHAIAKRRPGHNPTLKEKLAIVASTMVNMAHSCMCGETHEKGSRIAWEIEQAREEKSPS